MITIAKCSAGDCQDVSNSVLLLYLIMTLIKLSFCDVIIVNLHYCMTVNSVHRRELVCVCM